jgi:hypothetical protein
VAAAGLANKDERHLLDELARAPPSDLASIEFPLHMLPPHSGKADEDVLDMAARKPIGPAADRAETFHQVPLGPLAHPGANAMNQLMDGEIDIKAA